MIVRKNGEPHKIYTRNGGPYLGAAAGDAAAHPERPSGRLPRGVREHLHGGLRRHGEAGQPGRSSRR